jgi:MFS transporter, DHA1 family, inner membrane transport protein
MSDQVSILYLPIVWAQLLLSAVLFTAMFAPYTYLAAFLESTAGLRGTAVAGMLAWFGLAGIPGNIIAGRLSDRGPTRATCGIALILVMALLTMAGAGNNLAILFLLLTIWGAAHAAAFLSSQMRVMQSAPSAPAFAAALNISAANIGIATGAAVGGAIIEQASVAATGIGGAALGVTAVLLAWALRCIGAR